MIKCFFLVKISILIFLLLPAHVLSLTIDSENNWSAIGSGKTTPYKILLTSKQDSGVSINWKLVLKGRTLSSGRNHVNTSQGKAVAVSLPLQTPLLKPGINLSAQLIIDAVPSNDQDKTVHHKLELDIYGPDVLLSDQKFYRKLGIQLFDPIGNTIKIFDELKIPYSTLTRSQLVGQTQEGLVVIGFDIAIDQYRDLNRALVKKILQGSNVLILQPVSGTIPLSDVSSQMDVYPSSILFSNESIVQSFTEGFSWISDEPQKNHGVVLNHNRQAILAEVVEHRNGSWGWFHLGYKPDKGQLIICMLPFTDHLSISPIPKIIFGRLLAYAAGQPMYSRTVPTKGN